MSMRLCNKSGKHKGRQVEAFCLEKDCRKDRLLCFYCVFEAHSNHHVAYLHRELKGPISNLCQQIHQNAHATTRSSRDHIEATFSNITRACQRLGKTASNRLNAIRGRLCPQIEAIRRSFKRNSVDEILKDLTSNQQLSNEKLEKYASILRYFEDNSLADLGKLERNSERIWESFNQLADETAHKIEAAFHDLVEMASHFDFTAELPPEQPIQIEVSQDDNEIRSPEEILDQVTMKNIEMLNSNSPHHKVNLFEEGEIVDEEMKQQEKENAIVPEPVQSQFQEAIEDDGSEEVWKPIPVPESILEEEKEEQKEQGSEENSPSNEPNEEEEEKEVILDEFDGENGTKMVIKQPTPRLQQPQQKAHQEWVPIKESAKIQAFQHYLRKKRTPQVESVHIYATNAEELTRMLLRIDGEVIRQLVIKSDTRLCVINQDSVGIISQMFRLATLKIYFARDLSEKLAIDMVVKLEDLQELVLAEFTNLTPRFIEVLKTHNVNLTRVCFSTDINAISLGQESLQFLPDFPEALRNETFWHSLTNSGLMLNNLELQNANSHGYWVSYIRNSRQMLREVVITQTDLHRKYDYTHILNALSKCTKLQALKLDMLEFEEDSLVELLKNNPNLQVFVLSECNCVTIRTYRALFKYATKLKTLSLNLQDKFTARYGNLAKNLEVLVIRGCYGITEANFCSMISSLKKLKCLSVNYADTWIGRDSIWQISNMKSLKILNLSNNKGCLSLFDVKPLQLETFICSNSDISYKTIIGRSYSKTIDKLSISGTGGEGLEMKSLGYSFPKLTHLKIIKYSHLQGEVSLLDFIPGLLSIIVGSLANKEDVEALRKYCSTRKINYLVLEEIIPS